MHAVVAWGRVGIPTEGHQKLVDAVKSHAEKVGGHPMVFLSHTQDPKKNPLSYNDKIKYAQKAFGDVVKKAPHKTIIDVMKGLQDKGYKHVTVIAGEDRVPEYDSMLKKYNGRDYKFDSVDVKSAGHRDPDAEGVEGMSASKLRAHAQSGNVEMFKSGLASNVKQDAPEIMRKVRKGMNVEHFDHDYNLAIEQASYIDCDSQLEFEYIVETNYQKIKEQMKMAIEEKPVWEKPNPVKNSKKLSVAQKARARARARSAGRPYPNMVDNIWAAKTNEDVQVNEALPAIIGGAARLARLLPSILGRGNQQQAQPPSAEPVSTGIAPSKPASIPILQGRKPKENPMAHYSRTQRELQTQQYDANTPDARLVGTVSIRKLFQRMTPGQENTPFDLGQDKNVPQNDPVNLKRRNAMKRFKQYHEEINHDVNEELIQEEVIFEEKKVTLNKPFRTPGGPKKFSVYVKNDKGNVVKVNFGDPNLSIKRDQPERRKAYRARHNCANPGPRWKANYWSCRMWTSKPVSDMV